METKNITHYFIHDDIFIQLYNLAIAACNVGSQIPPVPNRAKKKSLISFLSTGRVTPIFMFVQYMLLPTTVCI